MVHTTSARSGCQAAGTTQQKNKRASQGEVAGPKVVVVAGTQSGCGKTLVSLALMAACVRRGLTVQAFKSGPDFIDPGHHTTVTGRPSHNLDGWILGKDASCDIFARYALGAPAATEAPDICIVEGAMGLFDGASGSDDTGSSAQLAKWLNAPVLLVADARSMARSAAAMVHGYTTLDSDLQFAGVVLNRVGSANHKELLTEAVHTFCPNVPLWGCLPRHASLATPSRHLGLVTADDSPLSAAVQEDMAAWIEGAVDLDAFLQALPEWQGTDGVMKSAETETEAGSDGEEQPLKEKASQASPVRIAVARDEAFCFYYEENLRMLEACGATLVPFSPLRDAALPEHIHGLYLGGGYPELHAETLAANTSMLHSIRGVIAQDVPVYAECGGFMYLTAGIRMEEGPQPAPDKAVVGKEEDAGSAAIREHALVGHYPVWCAMQQRFRALGYREIRTEEISLLGPSGTVARGHEFHYSFLEEEAEVEQYPIYAMADRKGPVAAREGYKKNGVLASYVHLHFGSNPEIPRAFVTLCRKAYTKRSGCAM